MIDLHLHTTASDGALSPSTLVARAGSVGLTIVSVTDHDTTGGLEEAGAAARAAGITLITGIEITSVEDGQDVHILGYFFEPRDLRLVAFLEEQRADRVRRVQETVKRLGELGCCIDAAPLVARGARSGVSVGRPHIADALVAAGHAVDRTDAFDRLIGRGRPAFVPRQGASAADVVQVIRNAGGLASLAHPGLTQRDDLVPRLAVVGLSALEARHTDHDPSEEARYRALAGRHGLVVTGGSDFHGDAGHGAAALGTIALPAEDFALLQGLAR